MTTGVFYDGVCHFPITTAFADACARANVADASGAYVQCTGYGTPTASGSYMVGALALRRYSTATATTFTSYSRPIQLQVCEVADWTYWSPAVSAWSAAVVAVIAARLVYQRVFARDTL